MPRRYKITGTMNYQYENREGILVQPTKVMYARTLFTLRIKQLFLMLIYDWVEVEEIS